MPGVTYFKPVGIPLRFLEENCLSLEEMEAIRLHDLEHLEQVECARQMNISRPTYQRVLASARRKIADSLLAGKALRIEGGNYELRTSDVVAGSKEQADATKGTTKTGTKPVENIYGGTRNLMKIAVITEDGKTISKHFGMAPYYMVVTLEDGKIVTKEQRNKAGHHTFGDNPHAMHAAPGEKHGYDTESHSKHATMAEAMADCKVLIAGGMGWGAYDSLKRLGIETIITDVDDIEEAVKFYAQDKLANLASERLH
jgi:predicted DNA-binding protein (UPF0251 family)/predicted Fe-Mo cluster-binding NifX family protein